MAAKTSLAQSALIGQTGLAAPLACRTAAQAAACSTEHVAEWVAVVEWAVAEWVVVEWAVVE